MKSLLKYLIGSILIAKVVSSVMVKRHDQSEITCSKLCQDIRVVNQKTDEKIAESEKEIASLRAECVCAFNKDIGDRLAAIRREVADMRSGCMCLKPTCPEGWSQLEDTCYIYQAEKVDWETAQERCRALGGDLAEANSAVKDDFLITLTSRVGGTGKGPWLGASKIGGQWVWTKSGEHMKYQNWAPSQPDNTSEYCLQYYQFSLLKWNNHGCNSALPFICEKPIS